MRSVVVVFPASMWAMMPMLRVRSSGVVRAIPVPVCQHKSGATEAPTIGAGLAPPPSGDSCPLDAGSLEAGSRVVGSRFTPRHGRGAPTYLPAIVGKCPVGFRHPVRVFLLLDRLALALRG